MQRLLPDSLGRALGQVIADQQREWARERERIEAESRALIAGLEVKIARLEVANEMLRVDHAKRIDAEIERCREVMAQVKDGCDGAPGPQGESGPAGRDADEDSIVERVRALIPTPERGERGEKGDPGARGDPGNPEILLPILERMVDDAVAAKPMPVPKDGNDGRDGEKGDVGERGEKGEPGDRGADGRGVVRLSLDDDTGELIAEYSDGVVEVAGVARGPQGAPGPQGEAGIQGERGERGADGERGPIGQPGEKGEPGTQGERGEKGDPGLDGRAGKDASDIAGGFRTHDGKCILTLTDGRMLDLGLVQGKDGAPGRDGIDGKDGEPGKDGRDGLGFDDLEVVYDGAHKAVVRFVRGDQIKETELPIPAQIYRGVWKAETQYETGDTVTWDGCTWHCNAPTSSKPSYAGNGDWQLATKHGRDGRDGKSAYDIAVEKGFQGSETEWLRSLKGPPGAPGKTL